MKTLLTLFVLFFSSSVLAEDISDFEIEGISIGDSLLDYFSEKEIIDEIEINKYMYEYTTDEFGEVYKYYGLQTYFNISFFVKPEDKNFIIYAIYGTLPHENNINNCYQKMNEISKEFIIIFKSAKKLDQNYNHPVDPSGRSKVKTTYFLFDNGDEIDIMCIDFEENLRLKNNWSDGLNISIGRKEFNDWLKKRIN